MNSVSLAMRKGKKRAIKLQVTKHSHAQTTDVYAPEKIARGSDIKDATYDFIVHILPREYLECYQVGGSGETQVGSFKILRLSDDMRRETRVVPSKRIAAA